MTRIQQSPALDNLIAHQGDHIYRIALLLAGNEAAAAQLLRYSVQQLARRAPESVDLATLLATMVAAQRDRQQRRAIKLPADADSTYAALFGLTLEQRLLLGSHLLLGTDVQHAAAMLDMSEAAARDEMAAALVQLSRSIKFPLPDAQPGAECAEARQSLMHASDQRSRDRTLRAHLSMCSACRAFEDAWDNLLRQVESSLRGKLRDRVISAELRARLAQLARPPRHWRESRALRLAAVPLAVLVVIVVLILPGFWRSNAPPVVESVPPLDPYVLVQQALDQVGMPTPGGDVWHAELETLWYFNNERYAPVRAELWLDQHNPARHRLQITHREGGAAYELQIGDGKERLWYALDPSYARSLSAGLVDDSTTQPQLVTTRATPDLLNAAWQARLQSGVWHTGAAYLNQAINAADLRTLGRQRIDEKTVQIVSFAGRSPFGMPEGMPDAPEIDVTILLAIEVVDEPDAETRYGRLYSVTELVGPPGGAQTSRITWRLHNEETLRGTASVDPIFNINSAWTGRGTFAERPEQTLVPLQPLVAASNAAHPAWLFVGQTSSSYWLPAEMPPGVQQAMMRWWPGVSTPLFGRDRPHSLSYYGADRSIAFYLEGSPEPDIEGPAAATLEIGPWRASMHAMRGERYLVRLTAPLDALRQADYGPDDGTILIDARGFSHTEMITVLEGLAPFQLNHLAEQRELFAHPEVIEPEAGIVLDQALATFAKPAEAPLFYRREENYVRHNPAPPRLEDPYHRPLYLGVPERHTVEFWRLNEKPALLWQLSGPDMETAIQQYVGPEQSWYYEAYGDTLRLGPTRSYALPPDVTLSDGEREVLEMLAARGGNIDRQSNQNGETLVRWTAPIALRNQYLNQLGDEVAGWPHLADLQPTHISSELQFSADGRPQQLRIYAGTASERGTLLREWRLLEQDMPPLSAVPETLRSGIAPAATFVDSALVDTENSSTRLQTITLDDARQRLNSPLLIAPPDGPLLLDRVAAGLTGASVESNFSRGWLELVVRNLALELTYYDVEERVLQLYQGAPEPIQAFLKTRAAPMWIDSEPRELLIAGQERPAWLMRSPSRNTAWIITEIDGTLLIAQGQSDWLIEEVLPLLADFRLLN